MEEKVSLPTKTKIAAWLMIVIGGILLISVLVPLVLIKFISPSPLLTPIYPVILSMLPLVIIMVLIYFIPGFFLLRKKRWAWWLAIFLFSILFIFNLARFSPVGIFIHPIFLILLLLDRKNFWKIVT